MEEEYAAKVALSVGISKGAVSKVMVALARETGEEQNLIEELEEIIHQIKKEQE